MSTNSNVNDVKHFKMIEVVACYATKVVELDYAISNLEEDKKRLESQLEELKKSLEMEREKSIPKALIARMIVDSFKIGDIPVSERILKESKGVLDVSCIPDSILIFSDTVRVPVTITSDRGDYVLSFNLGFVPELQNSNTRARHYPDFHVGYEKDVSKITKSEQKLQQKKQINVMKENGCTGNPS